MRCRGACGRVGLVRRPRPSWAWPRRVAVQPLRHRRRRSSTRSPSGRVARARRLHFRTGDRLADALRQSSALVPRRCSTRTRTSCPCSPSTATAGRPAGALAMADAVYGGLVEAGWPPARATHIGALMRYLRHRLGAGLVRPRLRRGSRSSTPAATRTCPTRTGSPEHQQQRRRRAPSRSAWRRVIAGLTGLLRPERAVTVMPMDRDALLHRRRMGRAVGTGDDRGGEPDDRAGDRHVPAGNADDVDRAVAAARAAFGPGPRSRRPSARAHLRPAARRRCPRGPSEIADDRRARAGHADQGRHSGSRPGCR